MEKHSGRHEQSERFGGVNFRKVCSSRTKTRAHEKREAINRKGHMARVEAEGRGKYNVYRGPRLRGR